MYKLLYELDKLQFKRSPVKDRLLLEKGLLTFFKALALIYTIGIGFSLSFLLPAFFKNQDPLISFYRILIYFFIIDFTLRYFTDKIPKVDIEKYLHLPIPKKTIVQYILRKSFFTLSNLFAAFFCIPFLFIHNSIWAAINIILISWSLHWIVAYVKTAENSFFIIIGLILIGSMLGGFEALNFNTVTLWIGLAFQKILQSPLTSLFWALILISSFYITFIRYIKSINLEVKNNSVFSLADQSLSFMSQYGLPGQVAEIEWKLILRHKKSKRLLSASLFFLLYGAYMYSKNDNESEIKAFELLFPAVLTTGALLMNYGQFFISWNTSHLDFYLSKPAGLSSLIKGKMMLLLFFVLVMTVLSTPYLYFGGIYLVTMISMGLFNAGVGLHIITTMSLSGPQPIDINKVEAFNTEGLGCVQYLMVFPLILLPIVIFSSVKFLSGSNWAAATTIGVIGIIGLILYPITSQYSLAKAESNKYTIGENFRNKKY